MPGVGATIACFALAQLGEGLAHTGMLSPAAGVWLPDAILTALRSLLFVRMRRASVLGTTFDRPSRAARRAPGRGASLRRRRNALLRHVAGRFCALAASRSPCSSPRTCRST
jgi:hypothetical protein